MIALDIIEDFLVGEGIKYLRLVSTFAKQKYHTCQFLPTFRMGIQSSQNVRRAWMSLTSLAQTSSYTSLPHVHVVLASTLGAQTRSSSLIPTSIPTRCGSHTFSISPPNSSMLLGSPSHCPCASLWSEENCSCLQTYGEGLRGRYGNTQWVIRHS